MLLESYLNEVVGDDLQVFRLQFLVLQQLENEIVLEFEFAVESRAVDRRPQQASVLDLIREITQKAVDAESVVAIQFPDV